MARYLNRGIIFNKDALYEKILEEKNLKFIKQYRTPSFKRLSEDDIATLSIKKHMWAVGDRYYKLAAYEYSDPELWWVIAWFNRQPTEAHVRIGDIVFIPHPITKVLNLYGA